MNTAICPKHVTQTIASLKLAWMEPLNIDFEKTQYLALVSKRK